ncbi:hypothetical protein NOGI109294_17370 [Nocardiopsis gilva]
MCGDSGPFPFVRSEAAQRRGCHFTVAREVSWGEFFGRFRR